MINIIFNVFLIGVRVYLAAVGLGLFFASDPDYVTGGFYILIALFIGGLSMPWPSIPDEHDTENKKP